MIRLTHGQAGSNRVFLLFLPFLVFLGSTNTGGMKKLMKYSEVFKTYVVNVQKSQTFVLLARRIFNFVFRNKQSQLFFF